MAVSCKALCSAFSMNYNGKKSILKEKEKNSLEESRLGRLFMEAIRFDFTLQYIESCARNKLKKLSGKYNQSDDLSLNTSLLVDS